GRHDRLHRLGILVPLSFAAIATPLQPVVGHFAGQRLADEQPIKLAAMEGLASSTARAPLELGGYWNGEELVGALEVPVDGLLSFLSTNDVNATLVGLDAVPADERPPVGVVHLAFQTMVAIGTALVGLVTWFVLRWWRSRRDGPDVLAGRWFLRAVVLAGPAAVVALETGWVTTEVGRQPWIVHGVMRTEDAVTTAGYIWVTLTGLIVVYTAMTVGALTVLRSMSARWRAGERDLAAPYGPAQEEPEPATASAP
ncbi:MAG: cytochrome ubiquinol oxidase subunit I, partial [Acidimicrobiales bacterium]